MHMRAQRGIEQGTRWWARLAGLISGLAGLGIAGLASWLVAPAGSPVPAVGELIINLLPGPLVNFGKESLGHADKPVLLAIIVIAVLILCALAGQIELNRRFGGAAVFAVVAVLGIIGIAAQPGVSVNAYVPIVVGLLLGYMILSTLIGKLHRWRPRRAMPSDEPDSQARRNFLGWTVVVGVLAAAAAVGGQLLASAATAVNSAREKLGLPAAAKPAPAIPAGADLHVQGLAPYVTANDDFYRIDTALQVPVIDPDEWTLKITGMVEQEVLINYADLSAKPLVEHLTTLTCVSNEVGGNLIGNALWLGYPIRELLAEAGPLPGSDMVLSTSDDGFTAGTPLSALTDPDREAILAIGMNGEPLPIEHGFPVRMVVPGLYGYVSATKWVTELKVTTFDEGPGLLDAAGLVGQRSDQDWRPGSMCRARVRSTAELSWWPVWRGPSTRASARSRCRSTRAAGRSHNSPTPAARTPGGNGATNGRPRPATTRSPCGRPTWTESCRSLTSPRPLLTGRPGITASRSRSGSPNRRLRPVATINSGPVG